VIVTVVYARPGMQHVLTADVAAGATVEQAIVASGLLALVPGLNLAETGAGIWNHPVALDATVHDGDRIEVYRPLTIDPKEARRVRAEVRRRRRPARGT
jgi:putative ubiquitin-RnfH superfamily antitoxin RatB of RatAB toxin-antitoxin module